MTSGPTRAAAANSRRRSFSLLVCAAGLLAPAAARAQGPAEILSGRHHTVHFDVRFRIGSRAEAAADWIAANAERELTDICRALAIEPRQRLSLWLYDDATELRRIQAGADSAITTDAQAHFAWADTDARFDAIARMLIRGLPKSGDQPRNRFFSDGLVLALREFVDGVHLHALAAYQIQVRKDLPPLAEMTTAADFGAWLEGRPGFPGPAIAGSWMRYVLDYKGAEAAKIYYGGVDANEAFADDGVERRWRKLISGYRLRDGVRALLDARNTAPTPAGLPEELAAAEGWQDLVAAAGDATLGQWRTDGRGLRGEAPGADWSMQPLGETAWRDAALRIRVRPEAGTFGVRLQFGSGCQALLTDAGAFLQNGAVLAASCGETLRPGATVEIVLARRAARAALYVDGRRILESATDAQAAPAAIGVARGAASFDSVSLRPL